MRKFIPVLPFVALIIFVLSMTFFQPEPSVTQAVPEAVNGQHIGFSKKETDEARAVRPERADMDAEAPDPGPAANPMREQLQDVASAYRLASRFPDYSVPLTGQDWQWLNPRPFVPRSSSVEGEPDLSVSIELSQYIIDMAQPVPVRVVAQSADVQVAAVSVMLKGTGGGTSAAVPLLPANGSSNVQIFEGVLSASELAAAGPGETAVVAQLSLPAGKSASVAAMVQIYASAADLLYLGDAYVDGPHLVIPAHFRVNNPGYYRVQANLYDAASGAPVSHLNSSFTLSESDNTGLLKVHAVTLREMQAAGPYLLKDFNIVRSPARPGEQTGFGSSAQASFQVQGFSLDRYADDPYVDEAAIQRQTFLDRISENPELQ